MDGSDEYSSMTAYFVADTDGSLWVTPQFLGDKLAQWFLQTCETFQPSQTQVNFVSLDCVITKMTDFLKSSRKKRQTETRKQVSEVLQDIVDQFKAFKSDCAATGGQNFELASFEEVIDMVDEVGASFDASFSDSESYDLESLINDEYDD